MKSLQVLLFGSLPFLAVILASGCQEKRPSGIASNKLHLRVAGRTLADWQRMLNSPDRNEQRKAVHLLGCVGPPAKDAVPALCPLLASKDDTVVSDAIWALEQIGPEAKTALPALLKLLHSDSADPTTKGAILNLLTLIDLTEETGESIVLPFLQYRSQPESEVDEWVRKNAAAYLGRLGPRAQFAVPHLRQALQDQTSIVRVSAARALWAINQDKQAIPVLVKVFQFGTAFSLGEALGSLREIGPSAKEAVPELLRFIEGQPHHLMWLGCLALWRIDHNPKALTIMLKLPDDPHSWAWYPLRQLGSEAKPILPKLLPLLSSRDIQMRVEAARVLWAIEKDPRAVEAIVSSFNTLSPSTARAIFSELGKGLEPALPRLLEIYQKEQLKDDLRHTLAGIIMQLDPQAAEKVGIR